MQSNCMIRKNDLWKRLFFTMIKESVYGIEMSLVITYAEKTKNAKVYFCEGGGDSHGGDSHGGDSHGGGGDSAILGRLGAILGPSWAILAFLTERPGPYNILSHFGIIA